MKKLVKGIVEFRQKALPEYREKFARLALGQSPDTLFIACSDSRVVPNLFASTDPGDLFVIRNVGNLIPECGADGPPAADESEAAADEFAIINLRGTDIFVCGHSDCGAMRALMTGREKQAAPNIRAWLRHGENALAQLALHKNESDRVNALSNINVLLQIEHLKTYPIVGERLANNTLKLHGWWFDLSTADVYAYEHAVSDFVLVDEEEAARILSQLS